MTIEEAIKHCEEKSDCTKCGQEHAQLKSWLQELLSYRQYNTAAEVIDKKMS